MPKWTKKAPGTDIGGTKTPIPVGGRDTPGHGFDPKKIVQQQTQALVKDAAGPVGDNTGDPAGDVGLVGTGFRWHQVPPQKEITQRRKVPRLITGPYAIQPSATYPAPPKAEQPGVPAALAKDASDIEPTSPPDNNGRPQWMSSPGQGGKDPVYRSQKPGSNGNTDELFSENINKDPPKVIPVDPDAYYIW